MVGGETNNSFHARRGMKATALRTDGTQSVPDGIPTETVGTREVVGWETAVSHLTHMQNFE